MSKENRHTLSHWYTPIESIIAVFGKHLALFLYHWPNYDMHGWINMHISIKLSLYYHGSARKTPLSLPLCVICCLLQVTTTHYSGIKMNSGGIQRQSRYVMHCECTLMSSQSQTCQSQSHSESSCCSVYHHPQISQYFTIQYHIIKQFR